MPQSITLRQSFVSDAEFLNKPENPGVGMKLQFKSNYNVKYSTKNICRAEIMTEITAENIKNFRIKFTVCGIFEFDPSTAKEDIHIEAYNELFPFARAFGYTLTTASGIPPIYIPKIDISSSEIFRIDVGNPNS